VRYAPRASGRATGARPQLIARTVMDMLRFWRRYWFSAGDRKEIN